MTDEASKPKPTSPSEAPEKPTRKPDPNVVAPKPVIVQEGLDPVKETRRPDGSVKAPSSVQVFEMIRERSIKPSSSEDEDKK